MYNQTINEQTPKNYDLKLNEGDVYHQFKNINIDSVDSMVTNLIVVDCFIEPLLPEGGQVNETLPFLVDLINPLLDLLCSEVSGSDEVVTNLQH